SGSLATYEWEPEQTGRRGGDGERVAELPLVEGLGRARDRGIVGAGHEPDHVLIAGHPRGEEPGAGRRDPGHSAGRSEEIERPPAGSREAREHTALRRSPR